MGKAQPGTLLQSCPESVAAGVTADVTVLPGPLSVLAKQKQRERESSSSSMRFDVEHQGLCGPLLVSSAGDAGCSESGFTDPECWLILRSHKGC